MSDASFDLHLLILSENSAGNALPSLRAIVRSMLRLVDPSYKAERDKAAVMSRLYLVSPYWCIESWLYQNTTVAKALCHKHYRGLHADLFDGWEQRRGELDEVSKPKDQVCFGSKHNHELASQGFPARAVYEVGKSFFETVERLKSSPALVVALAATHPGY